MLDFPRSSVADKWRKLRTLMRSKLAPNTLQVCWCDEKVAGFFVSVLFVVAGVQLLEHYGQLTDKLQKPLKSVPTVVFNGQYKEEDNKVAQNDFVKVLCQYIKGDKPADCAAKNTAHTSTLAFTTIFTCIAFYFIF